MKRREKEREGRLLAVAVPSSTELWGTEAIPLTPTWQADFSDRNQPKRESMRSSESGERDSKRAKTGSANRRKSGDFKKSIPPRKFNDILER
jgi:hypothetical protein